MLNEEKEMNKKGMALVATATLWAIGSIVLLKAVETGLNGKMKQQFKKIKAAHSRPITIDE